MPLTQQHSLLDENSIDVGRSVGDPFEPTTEQGPIAFKEQFEKVMSLIQAGKSEGATLLTGGDAFAH